ncbi:fatty acid desaturase 4, chloroplastic-like [Aristolochia californica]|uniref:fatty acid desaturase 4, chloroplastic-like n=1 Tax=Aristolochia californica TaxID=171875 RepID=UPI0035E1D1E2
MTSDHTHFSHLHWTPVHDVAEFRLTPVHRVWLVTGCISVAISLAKSITGSISSGLWLQSSFAAFMGYLVADLTSGVYHWAIDNYGGPETLVYGSYINTFQGHHRWPSSITYYEAVSGTYKIARGVAFLLLPLHFLINNPVLHSFLGVYGGFTTFSAQFHEWAHRPKSRVPPLVIVLQEMGLLLSPRKHAKHHRPPHEGSYCTISGLSNEFLDNFRVFRGMEMILFSLFGARPRSWIKDSETSSLAISPNHA